MLEGAQADRGGNTFCGDSNPTSSFPPGDPLTPRVRACESQSVLALALARARVRVGGVVKEELYIYKDVSTKEVRRSNGIASHRNATWDSPSQPASAFPAGPGSLGSGLCQLIWIWMA